MSAICHGMRARRLCGDHLNPYAGRRTLDRHGSDRHRQMAAIRAGAAIKAGAGRAAAPTLAGRSIALIDENSARRPWCRHG
jgi:hypothetical protein